MSWIFKKEAEVFLSAIFIVAFFISFISNASAFSPEELSYSVRQGIQYFEAFYKPILEGILGDYTSSDFFFIKVMLLILTFVVVRAVLDKVPAFKGNKIVIFIISVVISILSVRYMTDLQIVKGIIMSYDTLGIAITTIIPFIVWFFFVEKGITSGAGRRFLWAFFIVIFSIVWYNRYDEINGIGNYIYIGMISLAILALIFDRKVRIYFAMSEIRGAERAINDKVIISLLKELEDAEKAATYSDAGKRRVREIRSRLKELGVRGMD